MRRNLLGEGIIWSPRHNEVQWMSRTIPLRKAFWAYNPATRAAKTIGLPERLACFAPLDGSRILAGFASGLSYFDLDSGAREDVASIEADRPTTRLNDGKLDRQGRLVFGTMDESKTAQPLGQLWSFNDAPRRAFSSTACASPIRSPSRPMGGACISPIAAQITA